MLLKYEDYERLLGGWNVIDLLGATPGIEDVGFDPPRSRESDPTQGAVLRDWLDGDVDRAFAGRFIPVDDEVGRRAATLHVSDPAPFRDALIVATALVHRMAVVTR